jgi:hypothetical protein
MKELVLNCPNKHPGANFVEIWEDLEEFSKICSPEEDG